MPYESSFWCNVVTMLFWHSSPTYHKLYDLPWWILMCTYSQVQIPLLWYSNWMFHYGVFDEALCFSLCPCGVLMRGDFVLAPMVNETQNPKWSPSAAHEQKRSDGAHPASAITTASKSFSWRIAQLLLSFLPSFLLSFFLPSLLPSLFLAQLFSFPPL